MRQMMWILIIFAAIAFLIGGIAALMHSPIAGVTPRGYSRASANLALIAIAVLLAPQPGKKQT
jgi:hypothetical protein